MSVGHGDEAVRGAATDSVTYAFGDPRTDVYGVARLVLSRAADGARRGSALAVLFSGRAPVAAVVRGGLPVADEPAWEAIELPPLRAAIEAPLARWTVELEAPGGEGFRLTFEAVGEPAELHADHAAARAGGLAGYEQPCRARGTVRAGGRERRIDGLGQRGHAWGDPDWDRVELVRTVAAWTGEGPCAAISGVRPAGARHHAEEALWAALWDQGATLPVEEARLSTTYDGDGRMRRAGLELWPREDGTDAWARRGAGEVLCGSSLDLGALQLDCAFFRWHLEGREGIGHYDVLRRAPAA